MLLQLLNVDQWHIPSCCICPHGLWNGSTYRAPVGAKKMKPKETILSLAHMLRTVTSTQNFRTNEKPYLQLLPSNLLNESHFHIVMGSVIVSTFSNQQVWCVYAMLAPEIVWRLVANLAPNAGGWLSQHVERQLRTPLRLNCKGGLVHWQAIHNTANKVSTS